MFLSNVCLYLLVVATRLVQQEYVGRVGIITQVRYFTSPIRLVPCGTQSLKVSVTVYLVLRGRVIGPPPNPQPGGPGLLFVWPLPLDQSVMVRSARDRSPSIHSS